MNDTLVVVLNWNGIDDTEACISALANQTHRHDVLIIDNGSVDDSQARLEILANRGLIRLHREPTNLGFAGGVNVGIRIAKVEGYAYVALLNNDAQPCPDWLTALHRAMADSQASIATGLMEQARGVDSRTGQSLPSGLIDTAGDELSTWGMPFPSHRGRPMVEAPSERFVFSASGGASLYRTDLFIDIGEFDETFFAYFEDVDISFRARLRAHKIVYTPDAVVRHQIGATSSRIPGFTVRQTFKNLPRLVIKNVPPGMRLTIGARFTALYVLMLAKSIASGNGTHALAGAREAIGRLPQTIRMRRSIQSSRLTPTDEIRGFLHTGLPPEQHGMRRLLRAVSLGRYPQE